MVDLNKKFEDYTEKEFLKFVTDVYEVNVDSESTHRQWVKHFIEVIEHPDGSDLIYYPSSGLTSPEEIVFLVKQWRAANGKTAFKIE
jgi:hypothetical protein